jgi:hypothetical protein
VPTIAVATNGGVSVIKDDGTVVDITESSNSTNLTANVEFLDNGKLVFRTDGNTSYKWVARLDLPSSDRTYAYLDEGDMPYVCYTAGADSSRLLLSPPYIGDASTDTTAFTSYKDNVVIGTIKGFGQGTTDPTKNDTVNTNLVNYTSSSHNTGWMNGDIKLATLSDTDDTDVTGSELVTNGTFDTDLTGWDTSAGTVTWNSGTMHLTNTTQYGTEPFQIITGLTVGSQYVLTFDKANVSGDGSWYIDNLQGTTSAVGTFTYTITATSTSFTIRIKKRYVGTISIDNVSFRLAEEDRSVNGNGLQVFGTVAKNPVATGADLVSYELGFTAANRYVRLPNNVLNNLGTEWCFNFWVKRVFSDTWDYYIFANSPNASHFNNGIGHQTGPTHRIGSASGQYLSFGGADDVVDSREWQMLTYMCNSSGTKLFVNGKLKISSSTTLNQSFPDSSYYWSIGGEVESSTHINSNGRDNKFALFRISATAPSPEQIKKIYEDEKVLFQENAQATLYGSSDAVTALAYDDSTNLLHVGTSAGRSVFQGLRRVDNTTTAVGAAISASNGLVADE